MPLFSLVLVALGAIWLALGLLVGPRVITRAFHGESFAFLNTLVAAYEDQPLDFFLAQWFRITVGGAFGCFALAGFVAAMRSPTVGPRLVGTATPGTIGAIRMLVCGVLLMSTLWEDLPSTAALPREMVRPMGVIQVFHLVPGFEAFTTSPTALAVFQAATAVVLLFGLVGWHTRWMLPLGAVGYLLLAGLLRQYAWFYHTGLLALYLIIVLSLLPAHEGWSLDRLIRLWKGRPVPPADTPTQRYGWARYALWTALALPYVAAGLSKLRNGGLFWWDAVNFKFILFYSTLRPMEFDFKVSLLLTSAPDVVFEILALSALLGEVFYGLVLFFRWARWVFPVIMGLMHLGILFLQNILFFDLILLQAIFFNLRPLRQAVGRRLAARRGRVAVTFDDSSTAHARAVRLLGALDLFDRLTFSARRGAAWHAEYRGRTLHGDALTRLLAQSLPACWLLVPFLYLPGLSPRIERLLLTPNAPPHAAAPAPLAGGSPRLVLALASVLVVCWVFRIEFYPFTGMQMFSQKRDNVITYEIALAHLRSGEVVRAPIEASIGAMADSRYRRVLQMAFDENREHVSEAFLKTCASRWNIHAPPDRQITRMEVQQWRWDFLAAPDDSTYGDIINRRTYLVGSDVSAR